MNAKTTGIVLLIAGVVVILAASAYFFLRQPETADTRLGPILEQNGFVELRPPSNLFSPGAWVEVLNDNPLHLGIICQPKEALGLEDETELATSGSLTVDLQTKLAAEFSVGAEALKAWKGDAGLKAVRSVTFKLSGVKLMEIPDTAVINGFSQRSEDCREAIAFRLKNPNPVSMVKSALVADVTYEVGFEGNAGAEAKSQATKTLALNLGAKADTTEGSTTKLTGQQLVWGIRDDSALAKFGYGLPATGSSEDDRSILTGKGPITEISTASQSRRTFPNKQTFIAHDIVPLKQATTMACWATVYTMLRSWREENPLPVSQAVADLGPEYVDYFVQDTGLPGGHEREFVAHAGMVAEPPANYTLLGFKEMLADHGPLWIVLGDGISSHALVLSGIYGTRLEESLQAYQEAVFEFIDPLEGAFSYRPALEFMQQFEQEAAVWVNSDADDIPLRWQILHWP